MRRVQPVLFALLTTALCAVDTMAQCAMCRTSLTGSENGEALAQGINSGILFLVSIPFLVTGLIGLRIYWMQTRGSATELASPKIS